MLLYAANSHSLSHNDLYESFKYAHSKTEKEARKKSQTTRFGTNCRNAAYVSVLKRIRSTWYVWRHVANKEKGRLMSLRWFPTGVVQASRHKRNVINYKILNYRTIVGICYTDSIKERWLYSCRLSCVINLVVRKIASASIQLPFCLHRNRAKRKKRHSECTWIDFLRAVTLQCLI